MNARGLWWGILVAALIGGSAHAASPQPRIVYAVDSIAALQALDGAKYPDVSVTGFYAGTMRGGGSFVWQADSAAPPDNCTVFPAAQNKGRWLRRMDNVLDVTMCGAKWDNATDDSAAIAIAFTTASRGGFSVSCPGGTGNVATTMAPAGFAHVIFRCQGMGASTINCTVPAGRPCFLFQNSKGSGEIQAPQITDVSFTAPSGPRAPGAVIQFNSIGGGFTDDATTQGYMMRPIVQRVTILGGGIGIQCSKCFDGDFSLDTLTGQERNGFDLEGSDWMSIGDAGTNRIVGAGDYPIKLVSHGTFGNGDLVSHNDILWPRPGVKAYIYSSARTSYLEKNFLEGETHGACEIKIDQGASHAIVQGNHVTDRTVDHWLCVVPMLRQADFSDNQTTSHGQGPALFENHGTWKDLLFHHAIVHSGNWSESGFPAFWAVPALP